MGVKTHQFFSVLLREDDCDVRSDVLELGVHKEAAFRVHVLLATLAVGPRLSVHCLSFADRASYVEELVCVLNFSEFGLDDIGVIALALV